MRCLIRWLSEAGEEREEAWDTVDAFLAWAATEAVTGTWTAYEYDEEDDEWLLVAKGRLPGV